MKKGALKILVISFIAVFITAYIGSILTANVNTPWYQSIKPAITPPNFLFPIAWTIIFVLLALSFYFAFMKAKDKYLISLLFVSNLVLNIAWSFLYFQQKNPLLAFIELIALWISILLMILFYYKKDRKSAYLLIPYLAWVSFASVLNFLSI